MIKRIDWSKRGDYIQSRSTRSPGDTDIHPVWANEAHGDPDALVYSPDPASESGLTDRFVGYSSTARMVIVVIVLDHEDGTLYGVNAWKANKSYTRDYWNQEEE